MVLVPVTAGLVWGRPQARGFMRISPALLCNEEGVMGHFVLQIKTLKGVIYYLKGNICQSRIW